MRLARNGGFAGDGDAYVVGGSADGFDRGGVGGGACVADVAAEVGMGVADDLGEAVGVPTGPLAAAVLGDYGEEGSVLRAGDAN